MRLRSSGARDVEVVRAALRSALRSDFPSFQHKVFVTLEPGVAFVESWAQRAIAYQLERVRHGKIRRLIINLPPRTGKSITASIAFPAFVLGHDPRRRIICVSYAQDLATTLGNSFRAVLQSPWYQEVFPATRISSLKNTEAEVETSARGSRLATSVGGTLTGRGGDLVIIDDPMKPVDALSPSRREAANQWFTNTLLSRLNDQRTGAIVIVMQRLHMDDLVGHVTSLSDEWTVLNLPAIAECEETIALGADRFHTRRQGEPLDPVRLPSWRLDAIKTALGSDVFSAQYQQAPVPPGGAMIKRAWIKRYRALPDDLRSSTVLQSWDTAAKGGPDNDWSVCTTWRVLGQHYYLVDVFRDRLDYPGLKAKLVGLAGRHDPSQVLVEETGTAVGLLAELSAEVRGLTGITPEKNKETRMSIASAKFEAGQVFLPESAPWLPDLEAELFAFPGARHDDQVDSISQALNHENTTWIYERLAENLPLFLDRLQGGPW